ncbi:uncharacterized protein LOC127714619 [Mytilus californianus]|uniref:uncharacterized protein LOC127714619 n=1 Tax=Mytilus californianus TaxID=6549 RepID=UPI0022469C8D|nr:uncharacterized protein LOC127714619 [Mytilus californianus]
MNITFPAVIYLAVITYVCDNVMAQRGFHREIVRRRRSEPKYMPAPCVPTMCPAEYALLDNQTASPNCYYINEGDERTWYEAVTFCIGTTGANLWRTNSEAEANEVRTQFNIAKSLDLWTGAIPVSGFSTNDKKCIIQKFSNGTVLNMWTNCDIKHEFVCLLTKKTCT